jgi:hypothetical protein
MLIRMAPPTSGREYLVRAVPAVVAFFVIILTIVVLGVGSDRYEVTLVAYAALTIGLLILAVLLGWGVAAQYRRVRSQTGLK